MEERGSDSVRDRAERVVKSLAERGESRTREVTKAARERASRSARIRRETVDLISKEIRRLRKGRTTS